uniref:Protein shisa-4 n=1 Tax=Steinernema glaseri TaxID=37863 RepID=A0A1I8AT31_9BILA
MQPRHYLLAAVLASAALAMQKCPPNPSGLVLQCAFECCESLEGPNQGYYCCGADEKHLIDEAGVSHGRAERFVAYGTTLQVDYTMLVIGLILSIVISILLSFFCCLLCNGCWLHRRRNPQMYESVNESGFYPICCNLLRTCNPHNLFSRRIWHSHGYRRIQHTSTPVPGRQHLPWLVHFLAAELQEPRAIQRGRNAEGRPQERSPGPRPKLLKMSIKTDKTSQVMLQWC